VSITGAVGSSSSSYILVTFTPKSKDLQLGDGFVVNYASSLGKQIRGLSRGIDRVAETYAKSDDPSVRLLGSYYRIVADSLQRLRELLPEGCSTCESLGLRRWSSTITSGGALPQLPG